jgi:hypothetical protein
VSEGRQSRGALKRSRPVTYVIFMSKRPAPEPMQRLKDALKPMQRLKDAPKPTLRLNGAPKPTLRLNGAPKPTLRLKDAPKPTLRLNGALKRMLIKHELRSFFALNLQHPSTRHQERARHHKQP